MRVVLASAFLIAASAVTMSMGCSSSSSTGGSPSDGGTGGDTGVKTDGGAQGDGGNTGVDISGSKSIKVTVLHYATPAPTPLGDVRARIENKDGSGHIDVKTGPDGVATFNVNPDKGPFDVTVAQASSTAVSILGVTSDVPGNVVLYDLGATPAFTDKAITGSITGAGAANTLQIDGWDFSTVVTTPGATTYTSKYNYSPAVHTKLPLAVVEVDATGKAVKGLLTPIVDRTGQPMTTNIDMTGATAPTNTTINIVWPTAGLLTGTAIKAVDPKIVQDKHVGNSIVEKTTPDERGAAMFCGVANVDLPVAGKSAFHLQVFGGGLSPDIAGTRMTTLAAGGQPGPNDISVLIQAHVLTDGANLPVGAINSFKSTGANFGDVSFAADTTGYDAVEIDVIDAKAGAVWILYSMGPTLASRGLPHLPAGVAVADLAGDITPLVFLVAAKYNQGAKPPWEAILPDLVVSAQTAGGLGVDSTGR